ncbi:MAG: 3-hydroxyacyl-ACP dehydratase FabZ [Alphaproteobacteria bacterium]|nr:3-hydroxyacyl-ACP dehydratase FabZ [Alphaproteobacteria bacterium]
MPKESNDGPARIDQIDIMRIMELIPHRFPFLMIDRVVDLVPYESATGIKNVSINESYFQGHFPTQAVMPGVLVIEAMAQTAGVVVIHSMGAEAEGKLVYFMLIDSARFRRPIFPGDQIQVKVKKLRRRGNVWKFRGEAIVDGKLAAEAVFSAMIMDQE